MTRSCGGYPVTTASPLRCICVPNLKSLQLWVITGALISGTNCCGKSTNKLRELTWYRITKHAQRLTSVEGLGNAFCTGRR